MDAKGIGFSGRAKRSRLQWALLFDGRPSEIAQPAEVLERAEEFAHRASLVLGV